MRLKPLKFAEFSAGPPSLITQDPHNPLQSTALSQSALRVLGLFRVNQELEGSFCETKNRFEAFNSVNSPFKK